MKILSIQKIKNTSKRYDISVKKYHSFFANGIFVHNSSTTISYKDGDVNVCSRNMSLKIEGNENNIYIKTVLKHGIIDTLKNVGKNIAIQGELCGPGIQKNRLGLKDHKILVFDVWDIDNQKYFDFYELTQFCSTNELEMVPIVNLIVISNETIDELLEMTNGVYEGTTNQREGIVIRTTHNLYSELLKGRISFKVLNNNYLLKNE